MRVGLLKQNYDKNTKINALKTDIPPPPLNKKKPQKHNNPKFYRIKKVWGLSIFLFFKLASSS